MGITPKIRQQFNRQYENNKSYYYVRVDKKNFKSTQQILKECGI